MVQTAVATCFHCGLAAPSPLRASVEGEDRVFCCHGCQLAAELIGSGGLASFYRQREGFGRKPETSRDFPFDDPAFQASIARACDGVLEVQLELKGLHCAACVWLIERLLGREEGVREARVNLSARRLSLRWDPARVGLGHLAGLLASLGYPAAPYDPSGQDRRARARNRSTLMRLSVAALAALGAMFVGDGLNLGGFDATEGTLRALLGWTSLVVATPATLYVGWPFFKGAWTGLRARALTMDATIATASLLAYAASVWAVVTGHGAVYFDCLLTLLFLLLLGRTIEGGVRRRVFAQAERHWRLEVPTATRISEEGTSSVATSAVCVGDRLLVKPGERIPVDAVVESGTCHVDEAMLTGESQPVAKTAGSKVTGGTLNLDGALQVRAERVGSETTLSQIVRWVSEADAARSPSQRLADKVSGWFLPVLLLVALATLILNLSHGFDAALQDAIAVLIVTCPCALGLATPAAIATAMARGAREGILFKGGSELEGLAGVTDLVFDKTGTLTCGRMRVTSLHLVSGWQAREALTFAGSLEALSEHPVARAVVDHARGAGAEIVPVEDFRAAAGRGVAGVIAHRPVRVGSLAWLGHTPEGLPAPSGSEMIVYLEVEGRLVAALTLADSAREEAPEVVSELKRRGLDLMILSGDRRPVAEALARRLGISRVQAEVLPEGKREAIKCLLGKDRTVAMVGDGVNDAPALAQADVGIAMGQGTALAASAAGVVLLGDRLSQLTEACRLADRTVRMIRTNLILSALYNLVVVPVAATGHLSPQWAAVLMPLSSLLVLGNSLRLAR